MITPTRACSARTKRVVGVRVWCTATGGHPCSNICTENSPIHQRHVKLVKLVGYNAHDYYYRPKLTINGALYYTRHVVL